MTKVKVGLSRTTRIILLLAIDVCFFFVELIAGKPTHHRQCRYWVNLLDHTGYAVGSLALVADSFHMLKFVPLLCETL
jgi:zinc transporter 1